MLVLCILCLILLAIRIVYPHFIGKDPIVIKNLPLLERTIDSASFEVHHFYSEKSSTATSKLFSFNPNSVTQSQLVELGLREKTAAVFIKYRSKGFVFKQKEDFKKIYGITEELYLRLEPYIILEKETPKNVQVQTVKQETSKKITEINSADSVTLLAIKGIGPSFAKRIIKYRSMLGGFIKSEQLKEVFGFTEEMYEQIKPQIVLDLSLIKKLNLNKDDFKIINKHPYLSYELTKIICDKRRRGIIDADNLKEILNDEALYSKIIPYLSFD